jgi:polyisoprenyl-phosphate glycosyltransferase
MTELKKITILVPLYNEEAVLPSLMSRLTNLINTSNVDIEVLLIDDGSLDNTAIAIENCILNEDKFSAIFLSRNFGHAMALTAGLAHIGDTADAVFIIDGDLQDPPELLEHFVSKMKEGNDVVYGIRKNRKETLLKKYCYKLYYRLLKRFSNITMPLDAGDFSLISKRVVKQLNNFPEESRYLRGLRTWVGFKQIGLEYEREIRKDGVSKYSFSALMKLAFNGLFNFSELPVRLIGVVGFVTVVLSLIYICLVVYKKIFFGTVPEGFTTLIIAIILFSGVQMLSLGIIGEYVLRIFFQVKQRPLYIVRSKIIKGKTVDE